ncbi:MAG: hypothetical protein AAF196_13825 [Planctomycetota bacterium]
MSLRAPETVDLSVQSTATRLAVVVPPQTPRAWQAVIRHLGIPTVPLEGRESFDASLILLLGVDLAKSPNLEARVRDRWNRGVPIVADARSAAVLAGRELLRYRADRLVGAGFAFRGLGSVAVEGPIEALRSEDAPEAVSLLAQRPAPLYSLALPSIDKLDPNRTIKRRVATLSTGSVYGSVPACDLAGLSELIRAVMVDAASHRGHPLVTSSRLPHESAGVLALEVDVEDSDAATIRAVARRLETAGLVASFRFRTDGTSIEELSAELHRRGHECLRDTGVRESWVHDGPNGVGTADFDLIPRPGFRSAGKQDDRVSRARYHELPPLPIPSHAVTTTQLAGTGASDSEIIEHFVSVIRDSFLRSEPLVLRLDARSDASIPVGLFQAIQDQILAFESLWSMPVWVARLTELRQYWAERGRVRIEAEVEDDQLRIECDGSIGAVVQTQRGSQSLKRGVQRIDVPSIPVGGAREPGPSSLDAARPGEQESKLSTAWSRVVGRSRRLRRGDGGRSHGGSGESLRTIRLRPFEDIGRKESES